MLLCHKGAIPASLLNTFHIHSELHTYNTRQSSNFHIPFMYVCHKIRFLQGYNYMEWTAFPCQVKPDITHI